MIIKINEVLFTQADFVINDSFEWTVLSDKVLNGEPDIPVLLPKRLIPNKSGTTKIDYMENSLEVIGEMTVKIEISDEHVSRIIAQKVLVVQDFPVPLLVGADTISRTLSASPTFEEMKREFDSLEAIKSSNRRTGALIVLNGARYVRYIKIDDNFANTSCCSDNSENNGQKLIPMLKFMPYFKRAMGFTIIKLVGEESRRKLLAVFMPIA